MQLNDLACCSMSFHVVPIACIKVYELACSSMSATKLHELVCSSIRFLTSLAEQLTKTLKFFSFFKKKTSFPVGLTARDAWELSYHSSLWIPARTGAVSSVSLGTLDTS